MATTLDSYLRDAQRINRQGLASQQLGIGPGAAKVAAAGVALPFAAVPAGVRELGAAATGSQVTPGANVALDSARQLGAEGAAQFGQGVRTVGGQLRQGVMNALGLQERPVLPTPPTVATGTPAQAPAAPGARPAVNNLAAANADAAAKYNTYRAGGYGYQQTSNVPAQSAQPAPLKLFDSRGLGAAPGVSSPASPVDTSVREGFAEQQARALSAIAEQQAIINAGGARQGYKMGDVTKALASLRALGGVYSAAARGTTDAYGTDVGSATSQGNAALQAQTTLADQALQNQGQLAAVDLTGQYGLQRETSQATAQLAVKNAELVAKAQAPESAKTAAEAALLQQRARLIGAAYEDMGLSSALGAATGNFDPTTKAQLVFDPNAALTPGAPAAYVQIGDQILTKEQYDQLLANRAKGGK